MEPEEPDGRRPENVERGSCNCAEDYWYATLIPSLFSSLQAVFEIMNAKVKANF